jgi:NAD(P)-dependent dehydrogenase (short-subunit alcohol dehydrogenase family)
VAWCHPFALGLAQAGAAVAILARNEEKNQRILEELQARGVPTLAMRVDVTARGQLQPALEKVEETPGPVNIWIKALGPGSTTWSFLNCAVKWSAILSPA